MVCIIGQFLVCHLRTARHSSSTTIDKPSWGAHYAWRNILGCRWENHQRLGHAGCSSCRGVQYIPHVALAERWRHCLPHQLPVLICGPCQQAHASQELRKPHLSSHPNCEGDLACHDCAALKLVTFSLAVGPPLCMLGPTSIPVGNTACRAEETGRSMKCETDGVRGAPRPERST